MLDRPYYPDDDQPNIYQPLEVSDVADMLERPRVTREWIVEGIIPKKEVTLLAGDGGAGKTTLVLQLADARARQTLWLDRQVSPGRTLFYGCEDDEPELQYRLQEIVKQVQAGAYSEGLFEIISMAGKMGTELAISDRVAGVKATPRLEQLEKRIVELSADLLILDSAADVFGGDEIKRREVRAFIALLRGICQRTGCAVILLTHPSNEGLRTKSGKSGSTHWSNAVRSRLYFTMPEFESEDTADPDLRELIVKKNNRGKTGEKIMLRWRDGMFAPESGLKTASIVDRANVRGVFLDLLRQYETQGRNVSSNPGRNFAPAVFEAEPSAKGIKRKAFDKAMRELFNDDKIHLCTEGSPSKQRQILRVKDE